MRIQTEKCFGGVCMFRESNIRYLCNVKPYPWSRFSNMLYSVCVHIYGIHIYTIYLSIYLERETKYLSNVGNVTDCQSRNFEAKWCLSSFHINQVMSVWCGYYQQKKKSSTRNALPKMLGLWRQNLQWQWKKKLRIKNLQLINSIQFL